DRHFAVLQERSRPRDSERYTPSRLSLILGTRLGVYDITAPIGEGEMGQVYRARDTKLDRDVAIKILPGRSRMMPTASPVSSGKRKPSRCDHVLADCRRDCPSSCANCSTT